jgi:hypothetical protein
MIERRKDWEPSNERCYIQWRRGNRDEFWAVDFTRQCPNVFFVKEVQREGKEFGNGEGRPMKIGAGSHCIFSEFWS